MIFKPGRIIRNVRVLKRNSRGWELQDQQNLNTRFLLKSKYSGRKLKIGELIDSVVVIREDAKLIQVALKDYLDDLLRHYYNSNDLSPRLNEWSTWYERWSEYSDCAFIKKISLNSTSLEINIYKFFELDMGDYRLPIPAPKVIDLIQSSPRFYPHIIYEKTSQIKAGYAVYKTDDSNLSFPLHYQGKLIGKTIPIEKNISICLHGFIDPYKWHYDVWRHVFNEDKTNFLSCIFNLDNTCDISHCIRKELFKDIHPKIKKECNKYLVDIVTFFESETTKKMLKDIPSTFYTKIEMRCNGQIKGKPFTQIFHGVSHNWTSEQPLIHIIPLTFYFYSAIVKDTPDNYLEIREVKKL